MDPEQQPPPAAHALAARQPGAGLRVFVFALFFIFGGITSLNYVLIPTLKSLFTLSYADVMLVQSAFFAAYFIVSLPAAQAIDRLGYLRTVMIGLLCMAAGCLLFVPATASGLFMPYLLALFVLASGITIVQVIANPLILMLGAAPTALSRLILAQAFNSLGTTIFPFLGSIVILGSLSSVDPATLSAAAHTLYRSQAAHVISATYLGLAVLLLALAAMLWPQRHRLAESRRPRTGLLGSFSLLARPRFAFGAACIFLYVGAEVAIGSVIVNYLMQASVLGLATEQAGKHVPYYWGGAMVGRFIGAYLLRLDSPGRVLSSVAASAIALLLVSANSSGALAGYALLAIGLFNSIMFPTIFSLASEGLGPRAAEGSGIICMATVGGAIVPLLTGRAADLAGLRMALLVPAICYAGILCFGLYVRRPLLSA